MPPISTTTNRMRQREQSRWRPYGPPASFSIQTPESNNHPSPCSEKPSVRHSLKFHAPRPLQYENNNRHPTSPPPQFTGYACSPSTSTHSCERPRPALRLSTPVSLAEEPSEDASTSVRVPPTDKDLPPLPELRNERPMLACANTPDAKGLVARCVATIQDIWCLPPDRPLPPGFLLIGHTSTTTPSPVPTNPLNVPPPNPEVVAATASVDAEQMLTPPGSAVALQDSDSPDESTESDDGSEEDAGTSPPTPDEPSGHAGSVAQPHGQTTVPQVYAQPLASSSSTASHPSLPQHVQQTPHVSAPSSGHSFMSEYGIVTVNPAVSPQEVLMAQTMIPSPHAQHLLYFAHEVLRRSRTSCATLEIAMCYVGAIRDLVRNILAERAHLTRLARQYNCSPQQLDRRGVFAVPLHDPRRTFLASLVLATKFHQDRAYSNKAWAKLSGLPGREVTRCERALGNALEWRLWVGRMPPTTAALFGMDENLFMPPPTGINGAGDVVAGIVSCGRCVSPPISNVSVEMLEQELFQEELQNSGVHATFGGLDGIPGERDEIAACFMEASRRAELTYRHVPRKYRTFSTEPSTSTSMAMCAPVIQMLSSSSAPADVFPVGVAMPAGPVTETVPVMSSCWRPAEREFSQLCGCASVAIQDPQDTVPPAARWDEQVLTLQPPLPTRVANPVVRRSSTCSSVDSMLACMISDGDACTSCATGSGYHCSLPSFTVAEADYGETFCETVIASPEPFDSTIRTTPNLTLDHIPVPKTPRLAESAIPISSIVGAFRPQRSPPPDVVIPSADGSVAWHPPPNFYSRSLTPPAEFQMLPVHTKQGA